MTEQEIRGATAALVAWFRAHDISAADAAQIMRRLCDMMLKQLLDRHKDIRWNSKMKM